MLLEDLHRGVYAAVQLSSPGDTTSYRRQITGSRGLILQLLVQLSNRLEVTAVVSQQLLILLIYVELCSLYTLKLSK